MKKFYYTACLLALYFLIGAIPAFSQNEYEDFSQKPHNTTTTDKSWKQNLFTGGNISAGFYNGGSTLGISPMMGYHFNRYVDGGVVLNYMYNSRRDYYYEGDKYKQHNYGAGVFGRVFPVDFLFVQAQLEQNFMNARYRTSIADPLKTVNKNAPSLLLGGGYASGRSEGQNTFFYISVMVDVLKNHNSPYVDVDNYGTPNEKVRMQPVINAGVNIGLFGGRYAGRY
ncbi:MAG: hypothetical protein QM727_13250 [Niabella sp.]